MTNDPKQLGLDEIYKSNLDSNQLFVFPRKIDYTSFKYLANHGQRKYNKFKEIICALDKKLSSELGLIAGKPEMVISNEALIGSNGSIIERSSTIPEMEVESSDSKCPTLNK